MSASSASQLEKFHCKGGEASAILTVSVLKPHLQEVEKKELATRSHALVKNIF